MPLKPLFDMTFDKVEKGVHIFNIDQLKKVEEGGKTRLDLQCKVEGGICDGYRHTEFFHIKGTKNDNFGQIRFLGWFCCAFPDRAKDEFPDDFIAKNIDKIIKGAEGMLFGGEVIHKPDQKGEDRAQIGIFMTKKDALKALKGEAAESSKSEPEGKDSSSNVSDWDKEDPDSGL